MKNPEDIAKVISEDVNINNGLVLEAVQYGDIEIHKYFSHEGKDFVKLSLFVVVEDGWIADQFVKTSDMLTNAMMSDTRALNDYLYQPSNAPMAVPMFRKNEGIVILDKYITVNRKFLVPNPPDSEDITTSAIFEVLRKLGYQYQ